MDEDMAFWRIGNELHSALDSVASWYDFRLGGGQGLFGLGSPFRSIGASMMINSTTKAEVRKWMVSKG